jgi:hypothetical protein
MPFNFNTARLKGNSFRGQLAIARGKSESQARWREDACEHSLQQTPSSLSPYFPNASEVRIAQAMHYCIFPAEALPATHPAMAIALSHAQPHTATHAPFHLKI